MNLERFHSILATATRDTNDSEVPTRLQELINHLEHQSNDPANPDHQRNVSQSRSGLLEALTKAPSNDYPPSWENTLRDYGLTYFLAKNVKVAVDEAFRDNDITPQSVFDSLQPVRDELHESLEHTDQILASFERLGVETDDLLPGDVEIAYTIPRELREGSPSDLGKEFGEIEKLLKPFAEMATGETPEFEVRSISSSDFTIVLSLNSDTVIGVAGAASGVAILTVKAVHMVAAAVREILGIYKDIVTIGHMKSNLGNMDGTQEKRDTIIIALQDFFQDRIDTGIAEAADRLCDKFNKIKDKERTNELQNYVRTSMRKIAALIDNGYGIETRCGQLPEPETEEEEGEGDEGIEGSQEIRDLREALKEINEIQRDQLTFEREGEPILSLPDPFDDESRNKDET